MHVCRKCAETSAAESGQNISYLRRARCCRLSNSVDGGPREEYASDEGDARQLGERRVCHDRFLDWPQSTNSCNDGVRVVLGACTGAIDRHRRIQREAFN